MLDSTANSAITSPVASTAPTMPSSWDLRTFLTSPPMPTDCTAPSNGSSGQMMNFQLADTLVPAVTKPCLRAAAMTWS